VQPDIRCATRARRPVTPPFSQRHRPFADDAIRRAEVMRWLSTARSSTSSRRPTAPRSSPASHISMACRSGPRQQRNLLRERAQGRAFPERRRQRKIPLLFLQNIPASWSARNTSRAASPKTAPSW
jgi:hypothetical protein